MGYLRTTEQGLESKTNANLSIASYEKTSNVDDIFLTLSTKLNGQRAIAALRVYSRSGGGSRFSNTYKALRDLKEILEKNKKRKKFKGFMDSARFKYVEGEIKIDYDALNDIIRFEMHQMKESSGRDCDHKASIILASENSGFTSENDVVIYTSKKILELFGNIQHAIIEDEKKL